MNETIFSPTRVPTPARSQGHRNMKFTFAPESEPLEGYTIKRALAKGGFGEVYLAESAAGKQVALKLLRDNLDVELRGIRHCLNLKHANLVPIYDIKTDADGDHWIIMEFVDGPTLADILDDHPHGLPLEQVREWLSQIVAGLDFLHDQGIVHRDLKPANIFEERGDLKIGDVGLSKYINASHHTQTQSVGTVSYMAPEVSRGKYGRELDIYSLGVMLYEMLTGDLPFRGDTPGEVLMRHLTEHPNLSKVPERFRPVLERALAKDPKQRTATAGRLLQEFEAAFAGRTTAAEPIFDEEHEQERLRAEVNHAGGYQRPPQSPPPASAQTPVASVASLNSPGKIIAISAVGFIVLIFMVRTGGGLLYSASGLFLAFMAGLLYLGYRTFKEIFSTPESGFPPANLPRNRVRSPRPQHPYRKRAPYRGAYQDRPSSYTTPTSVILDPSVPHKLPLPRRMSELMLSLGMSTIFSAIVSAILMWWTASIETPLQAATFTLCLTLASWAMLTENKFLEGRRIDTLFRRFRMLIVGAGVGAGIYWTNSWLFMPFDFGAALEVDDLVRGMGPERLIALPGDHISMINFMIYFGLLFGLRRWWWHTDNFRAARVQLSSLIGTFMLAIFIPIFVSFPFSWSILFATGLSAVVQLSAAWCPHAERKLLLDHPPEGGEAI